MSEEHWASTFESDSITDDNRESFVNANSKYATEQDAIMGGYNAQKAMGKPFRIPESMDKLPDDASREDFQNQARNALGIVTAKTVDDFSDVNFKDGLAEGKEANEAFVGMVKNWAVEEGIPLSIVGKMASFYNGPLSAHAAEAMATQGTEAYEAKASECNEALVKDYGSEAEVEKQTTLFKKALSAMAEKNGLDVDATNEVVAVMADAGVFTNANTAKIMLQAFSPMAAEGGTLNGDGGGGGSEKQQTPYQYKKQRFPNTPDAWGKESDTWDNESQQMRNIARIK